MKQIKLNAAVRLYRRRLKEAAAVGVAKGEDRKALDELEGAFDVFKRAGNVEGVQTIATEIGRIVEANRQIKRDELDRLKSSEKIKDAVSEIDKFSRQGLDVSKAQAALDRAKIQAGTNQNSQNKKNLFLLEKQLIALRRQSSELDRQAKLTAKQKGSQSGGAFPLLFGQAGAAVGGAIGGVLGEKSGIGGLPVLWLALLLEISLIRLLSGQQNLLTHYRWQPQTWKVCVMRASKLIQVSKGK